MKNTLSDTSLSPIEYTGMPLINVRFLKVMGASKELMLRFLSHTKLDESIKWSEFTRRHQRWSKDITFVMKTVIEIESESIEIGDVDEDQIWKK